MFDVLAPVYDDLRKIIESGELVELEDIIQKEDQEPLNVLDVGGGTGNHVKSIFESKENVDYHLLDKSTSMIDVAEYPKFIVKGDALNLPYQDETFDYVFCIDAIHHFKDRYKALKEMKRVVKYRGQIIIVDLDPNSMITKFISLAEKALGEPGLFFEIHELRELFKEDYEIRLKKLKGYIYFFQAVKLCC